MVRIDKSVFSVTLDSRCTIDKCPHKDIFRLSELFQHFFNLNNHIFTSKFITIFSLFLSLPTVLSLSTYYLKNYPFSQLIASYKSNYSLAKKAVKPNLLNYTDFLDYCSWFFCNWKISTDKILSSISYLNLLGLYWS